MNSLTEASALRYTAYTKDGLELYIQNDSGKVYASQSAMARMLGLQQGHLSSVLQRASTQAPEVVGDLVKVDLPTVAGMRNQTLYGVKTISAMAVKYCPTLAEKFTEMGATVYLYQLMGYKVTTDVTKDNSAVKSAAQTYNESLETAYEAMGKLLRLHRFAEDKPGLEAYLELAETKGKKALAGGVMSLAEMAEQCGISFTPEQSRIMGRAMAANARSQYGYEPEKIRRRFKDKSDNYQSYMVTGYSSEYLPLFESLAKSYEYMDKASQAA